MSIEVLPSTEEKPVYRVSNSEIQTFKDCRRRWYFNYYRRLQPKEKKVSGPLALGSRVHAALDDYYANGTPLLEAYAALMDIDRAQVLEDSFEWEDLENEGDLGRIMLEGYLQWLEDEGIEEEFTIISTEEMLRMPLDIPDAGQPVELQGKLDMRVRRNIDDVRMFLDFKTVGGSFTQYAATAHLNEQILTYMTLEAYQNTPTDRSEGGIFRLLKKVKRTANAKPPFYEQFEVRHNIFTLRSFWARLHGSVGDLMRAKRALDEGESHLVHAYPRPSQDCRWKCPFFAVCPMMDDGSAVEDAIANIYEVGNPNARYGEEPKGSE